MDQYYFVDSNIYTGMKYEAATRTNARRPVYYSTKSEDQELQPRERQTIISDSRDMLRNFTLAGFVIRKHLQQIAYYRFNAGTPDRDFNSRLEKRISQWMRAENCDASRRHSFDELLYLHESARATDGDSGILKLNDNRLQLIEGDRIRQPTDPEIVGRYPQDWIHGVKVGRFGEAKLYAIHRRNPSGGFVFERIVRSDDLELNGYYTRADQVRGVSLTAPAARMFALLYESLDLALAKIKMEQALGIKTVFKDDYGFSDDSNPITNESRSEEIADNAKKVYGSDILHFNLREGEDAQVMESNNPSSNFMQFCEMVLRMIFAAFDIPYSFYDGSKTNYYGSEGEFEQYVDGIERKQSPTIAMLDRMSFDWLIYNWTMDQNDPLLIPHGWTIDDLRNDCGWSGAGLPSWRMYRNIKNMTEAINAGLLSPISLAGDYGYDWRKNLDDLATVLDYARSKNLDLSIGKVGAVNVGL